MRILVSEKLSENRFKTPEGYLICTNAILARTGKQTYLRREVFGDSCNDADKEVEVDRTAEEVFAPETLASFENKPLCVEHPDEDVNADNHNLLSVGYVRDVKKDVVDGNEVMTATLVITDKYGIDEVESGRKTDLSCGYDCDIVDDEHPQQRHIRGNHVAICERGRAGIARIVDSVKDNSIKSKLANFKGSYRLDHDYVDVAWDDTDDFLEYCSYRGIKLKRERRAPYGYDRFSILMSANDSTPPKGYKVTGNNYAWELAGTAKDKKEAANKFTRKYPELENIWGISELLNFMIQSNKDVERDTELGYALHFDYDEDTKKFYIAFVEKKYRYDDSIEDSQHQFEVCYIDYDKRCVVIEANSTDDAVAKFRRKYGMYHIVHVKQIDSMKNMEDGMKKYAEDKHGRTFTLEEIEGGKVKATNMGGREKIFSGWKEAEEEFRKRGITILDSFYDIVEDSVKDMKVSHDNIREQPVYVMQSDVDKNLFFYIGKTHAMKEGEFTYAQYDMEGMTPDELRKDLEAHGWHKVARGPAPFIDEAPHEDRLWKVYLTGGIDANNVMYVKADNEAMARKIAERNTDEKIIRITEYGDTPLTKIDKERILRNPNRYFDSEKKIEKIAKIVSKLK